VTSEILRIRPISLPDTEASLQEPLKANGSTRYGTFDAGPPRPHHGGGGGGFGSNPPPQGGWITYIRSFNVFVLKSIEINWIGFLSTFMA
jgi:hypothetical protein